MPNDQPREQLKSALDLARSGDYVGARRELEALLASVPDFADGHYYHGLACRRLGDLNAARASLERCLEMDPLYHDARERLRDLVPNESRPAEIEPTSIPVQPPISAPPKYVPELPSLPPIEEPYGREGWIPVLVKPAGFWIRGIALLIDVFLTRFAIMPFTDLLLIPFYPYLEQFAGLGREAFSKKILEQALTGDTQPVMMLALFLLVHLTVEMTFNTLVFGYFHYVSGQSPGKRLLGVRVVDNASLDYLTIGQSIWRYAASTINPCTCMVGYVMAAMNPEKGALHDYLASTRVVYSERVPMEMSEKGATATLIIMAVFGLVYSFL